jgi:hypothetical protein
MDSVSGQFGRRDPAARIANIKSELEHLYEVLDTRMLEARAACANGDPDTAATALRWMLALSHRMLVLTREWRDIEPGAIMNDAASPQSSPRLPQRPDS